MDVECEVCLTRSPYSHGQEMAGGVDMGHV